MDLHQSCIPSNTMKKNRFAKKPDEGPVYLDYKSYKAKPVSSSRQTSVTKPAPLSSGETVPERDQQYADLQKELKQQKEKQSGLLRSIEKLQAENEQIKSHMAALITPQTHQKIEHELDQSLKERDAMQLEIRRLLVANQQQIDIVDDLKTQIADLQRDQDTLRNQLELEQQAKIEQANTHEQLINETTSKLKNDVESLIYENQTLEDEKHLLQDRLEYLQNRLTEMDRKVNVIGALQKKLKMYETKNKTLSEQHDSSTRFVQVLENDMQTVKNQNANFVEQNKELQKQLSVLKKSLERLRQKYDELNKVNKILKEKETRYMYHERFNVGKYAHKIPSLFDDFGNDNNINSAQNQNYMRAAKNVKNKSRTTEVSDQERYYLLHRQENIKDNKSDSTGKRKVKK